MSQIRLCLLMIGGCLLVSACGGSSTGPSAPAAAAPTPAPGGPSPCTVAAPPESGWTWTRATFPGEITNLVIDEADGRTWVASNTSTSPIHVFVTNDAGATWRPVLDGVVDFGGLRTGPTAIYAPVLRFSAGLNVSRDHGRSWSSILRPSGDLVNIQTVLPSRFRPGLLLAGGLRFPGELGRSSLFRSLDNEAIWTEVVYDDQLRYSGDHPPRFAEDGSGVILLARRDPQGGLYFRSTDAGASWQAANGPSSNAFVDDLLSDTVRHRIYGFANGFIAVTGDGGRSWSRFFGRPTSPTALVVDERRGGVFAAGSGSDRPGLYYLPDGANGFRPVSLDGQDGIRALAVDRCGSILLAGAPGLLLSSPIPRNP